MQQVALELTQAEQEVLAEAEEAVGAESLEKPVQEREAGELLTSTLAQEEREPRAMDLLVRLAGEILI